MSLAIFAVISGHFLLIRLVSKRLSTKSYFGRLRWGVSWRVYRKYFIMYWTGKCSNRSINLERIVYVCFFCVRGSGFLSDVPLYGRGMQLFRSSRSNDKIHGKSPVFLFRDHAFSDAVDGSFSFILKMAAIIREILHGLAMCILDTIFL